jgi:hypothetical protein
MKTGPIKQVSLKEAAPDPTKDGGHRDQFQANEQVMIEEDDRGYIVLTAMRQGKPHPERGVVRVPPGNVRGIRHFPAPAEVKK